MHHLVTMDKNKLEIITAHPIGSHLDAVRIFLSTIVRTPADLNTASREGKPIHLPFSSCSNKYSPSKLGTFPSSFGTEPWSCPPPVFPSRSR
ncbi:hypothetical protein F5Y17DRAFT_453936 [Xylariaceae sp. FL0594]|nr:hypothetical protein F5Y17DRAFT_453936 [Xylariaceae sp. FL0594]